MGILRDTNRLTLRDVKAEHRKWKQTKMLQETITFKLDTVARLGRIVSDNIGLSRYNYGWGVGWEVGDPWGSKQVYCHRKPWPKGHKIEYSVFDSESGALYHLCKVAFESILIAGRCVTKYREWQQENKGVKRMTKAPKPTMIDFANLDTIKRLAGGKGKKIKATITGEPILGKYGWQLPLAAKGENFIRTIKENSFAYKTLFDAYGDDFADWVGKTVILAVEDIESGEFEGQEQIVFST